MSIYQGSRYRLVPAVQSESADGEVEASFSLRPTSDQNRTSYKTIQTRGTDTMESLARRIYGDGGKWYIIADANPEIFWPLDLAPGTTLRIPQAQIAGVR